MTATAAVTVVDLSADASGVGEVAAATHIGPVRRENQDAFAATALGEVTGIGLVLADGMGGMSNGGEAAAAAIAAAVEVLATGAASAVTVAAALHAANRAVAAVQARLGGQPGTTLTLAVVDRDGAIIGHAGDSRAYLVRGDQATVLTSDHSWVGEQVRAGALPAGSERHHPRRNVITMAVMGGDLAPEVLSQPLSAGDILMLCSDGFWEPLTDEHIAALLGTPGPLTAVVGRAAESALGAGGTDNVTVLALRLPA